MREMRMVISTWLKCWKSSPGLKGWTRSWNAWSVKSLDDTSKEWRSLCFPKSWWFISNGSSRQRQEKLRKLPIMFSWRTLSIFLRFSLKSAFRILKERSMSWPQSSSILGIFKKVIMSLISRRKRRSASKTSKLCRNLHILRTSGGCSTMTRSLAPKSMRFPPLRIFFSIQRKIHKF